MVQTGEGVALSRAYFTELVAPLLRESAPEVRYAAARVGAGSEVLGLDDATSRDHDWGLRLQLFVSEASRGQVESVLDIQLPDEFRGCPVRFGLSGDAAQRLRIDVMSVDAFVEKQLGFDPRGGGSVVDWLSLSGQAALEVTAGAVFEDQTGELTRLREALTWYPDDIWRYVVACDWQRLDQELPLVGRAGGRGDELGSRVIAARLVDIAVHLAFMLSRSWPPYAKWRGSAFGHLRGCSSIATDLGLVLAARSWEDRQTALSNALNGLARMQGQCGLPAPRAAVEPFWDRPHLHLCRDLVPAVLECIESPEVRALPVGVGSAEQQTDNVDILVRPDRRRRLTAGTLGANR
ncbi:DUF4037 domain-containing protein [Nocardioides sp. T2.26MG-1]|uniref:DUF4037 domain-containing protein n=1 Tax=Nocardioides sp. T2.26MG-1 TaxID=3041166 RepID=UPI002477453B|nr:DUF4037 domain-containing protein [Nocardioides sp. T2.26MG-1]CAI9413735.1 hypothetical protein HIDPHFAB_02096 [Nocardioides sp. T2.26MG-1]